jgi:hypothetical protein
MDGRSDMTNSVVGFRNFAKALNELKVCLYSVAMQPIVIMGK